MLEGILMKLGTKEDHNITRGMLSLNFGLMALELKFFFNAI
jgi:hypothetical protein